MIRTVIYEVGVLTDADNDTNENSTEVSHQIDLTFFDPKFNGSDIDLTNVPLPFQTNVSGTQVVGVAPVNLGFLAVPPAGGSTVEPASAVNIGTPLIPNAVVSVRHNISTSNPEKGAAILSSLPEDAVKISSPRFDEE